MKSVIAVDLGASNGRVILGSLDQEIITLRELCRFENGPIHAGAHMYTDILKLLSEIKLGIKLAVNTGICPASIALDTWGADYGLLDEAGQLLRNPFHYRDPIFQTEQELFQVMPYEEIYPITGIQKLPCDTMRQLFALTHKYKEVFHGAGMLLFIPDLLNYFLCGKASTDVTFASTTGLLDVQTNQWSEPICRRLGLPMELLPPIHDPGIILGPLTEQVCEELQVPPLQVVGSASHDTAAAVAAVPARRGEPFLFLSTGTWTILGTETRQPCVTELGMQFNFSNEKGFDHTIRLLKNCSGFWIFQECIRQWKREGVAFEGYQELCALAKASQPFECCIDVMAPQFFEKDNMVQKIQAYCRETGQPIPETLGQITRTILESLAMEYAIAKDQIQQLTGQKYDKLYLIGGGVHNALYCQFVADCLDVEVAAGPAEGTAIGNIAMQLIAIGALPDLYAAREIINNSFEIKHYFPQNPHQWDEPKLFYQKLKTI